MMEFGMPVLLGREEPEEAAALCRELGLSFVELNMNLPRYQAGELERTEELARAAGRNGVYITVHLDENLDPGALSPPWRTPGWRRPSGRYRRRPGWGPGGQPALERRSQCRLGRK